MNINNLCMGCMKEKPNVGGACPYCGFDEVRHEVALHHLPLRTILAGKVLIGRVLGEGGFGITYIGYDLNLNLSVAVKEFYPSGYASREASISTTVSAFQGKMGDFFTHGKEKFVDEARRLARFRSLPGIVAVNDFIMENGTAYIIMEYVDGTTFKAHLANVGGRMPSEDVFLLMRPVMESLSKMHEEGIIHRDISPDNIMITKTGEIRLIDFGAARDFEGGADVSRSILLKPGYAPVEQYSSRGQQGPWTDVYAICATMYKAMTGVTPQESSDRITEDQLQGPSTHGIAINPYKEQVIMRGMAFMVKDRYQSMGELITQLYNASSAPPQAMTSMGAQGGAQMQTGHTVSPLPINTPQQAPKKTSKKTGFIVAGGIVAAIAVLFAVVSLFDTGGLDIGIPTLSSEPVSVIGGWEGVEVTGFGLELDMQEEYPDGMNIVFEDNGTYSWSNGNEVNTGSWEYNGNNGVTIDNYGLKTDGVVNGDTLVFDSFMGLGIGVVFERDYSTSSPSAPTVDGEPSQGDTAPTSGDLAVGSYWYGYVNIYNFSGENEEYVGGTPVWGFIDVLESEDGEELLYLEILDTSEYLDEESYVVYSAYIEVEDDILFPVDIEGDENWIMDLYLDKGETPIFKYEYGSLRMIEPFEYDDGVNRFDVFFDLRPYGTLWPEDEYRPENYDEYFAEISQ